MQLNRSTDYAIQMLVYLAKAGKTVSSSNLLEDDSSHRGISSLSAPDQCEVKGGRVYPGRPWSVWRVGIGKSTGRNQPV